MTNVRNALRDRALSAVGWVVAVALIARMAYAILHEPADAWTPVEWGVATVVLVYAISVGATNSLNPLAIGLGDDGKLSLSKSQTVFWTYVVLYAFSAIYAHDAQCFASGKCQLPSGGTTANAPDLGANALIPISFPNSVLLLLGFSVTSLVAAAGITRSQIASGQIDKTKRTPDQPDDLSPRWLIADDDGRVDLTRFQVVLWTLAAVGAFLSDAQLYLSKTTTLIPSLPDVGSALVLLMGIGQAAYIGGKLVVTPKARIYRVGPSHAAPPAAVTVSGSGFGATRDPAAALLMDGAPITTTSWSDTAIVFAVPSAQPSGAAWPAPPASTTVKLTVALGAVETDPVPFTVP